MKKTASTTTKPKATKTPATAGTAQEATTVATRPAKAARPARNAKAAKPAAKKATTKKVAAPKAAGTTKKDQVLALISRAKGATLDEIMVAMGWQRHTVRGFISILNKAGAKIESSKSEAGARTYKAA